MLTVVATGTGVVVVTLGHILSTTTIDTLFWVAIVYVVLRTLSRDAPRGWLLVGLLGRARRCWTSTWSRSCSRRSSSASR